MNFIQTAGVRCAWTSFYRMEGNTDQQALLFPVLPFLTRVLTMCWQARGGMVRH